MPALSAPGNAGCVVGDDQAATTKVVSTSRAPSRSTTRSTSWARTRSAMAGPSVVEVAGQLQLVARGLAQLAARSLVEDALQVLGAEGLVVLVARLEQAEAEAVDLLVLDVLLARQVARHREPGRRQLAELLQHR